MKQTIFLPNAEESTQLIKNAWKQFLQQAKKQAGWTQEEVQKEFPANEAFIAGYCFGYNDGMGIVKDQLESSNYINDMKL